MSAEKQFAEECLAAINHYRAIHQVAPLSYNHGLEQVAKHWTEQLSKTNVLSHNPHAVYQGKDLGENIASHWSSSRDNYTGDHAVAQWYNEIERYDFKTHEGPKTGHFTQVVWKGTKEVGVGRAQSKDGTWIAVANFLPPGNVIGEYPQNVLLPKDGKIPALNYGGHLGAQKHEVHPTGNSKDTGAINRTTRKANDADVTVTTKTETFRDHDGSTKVKVTEKTHKQGHFTKVKVTETTTAPDGSRTTRTTETTETKETTETGI